MNNERRWSIFEIDKEELPLTNDASGEPRRQIKLPKYSFAVPYLYNNMDVEVINPTMYLKCMGELLFLALSFSWLITLYFHPEVVENNPLRVRLGYNNLCVGWDVPPAIYFASISWVLCAYFGIRFCYLDHIRTQLAVEGGQTSMDGWKLKLKQTSNLLYAISIMFLSVLFLVTPEVNVYVHTGVFCFLIVARWMVILGLFIEFPEEFEMKDRVWMTVYTICSLSMPVISMMEYYYYDTHGGQRSPIPAWVLGSLDYTWFFCLATTAKFVPENVVLLRRFKVASVRPSICGKFN